ncbi:hypothetical protein EMIT047CA2_10247 [Pseudomonas soli]
MAEHRPLPDIGAGRGDRQIRVVHIPHLPGVCSVGQRRLLQFEDFVHAFLRQRQHGVEVVRLERRALGGALHLDETTGAGHDHVQVGLGGGVLEVVEVEHGLALVHAHRYRSDHVLERVATLETATFLDHRQGVAQSDHGAGDRGSAGAAVGLDHVAVDVQGDVAELAHVQRGAQGAANQALDLEGAAALLATAGLALVTLAGGARQHAVLGGQPTLALAFEEAGNTVLDADRADDLGVTELDQNRSFGVLGVVASNADRAELIGGATTWTFHLEYLYGDFESAEHYRARHPTKARLSSRSRSLSCFPTGLGATVSMAGLGARAALRYNPAPCSRQAPRPPEYARYSPWCIA